jgi:hypothetical protein
MKIPRLAPIQRETLRAISRRPQGSTLSVLVSSVGPIAPGELRTVLADLELLGLASAVGGSWATTEEGEALLAGR